MSHICASKFRQSQNEEICHLNATRCTRMKDATRALPRRFFSNYCRLATSVSGKWFRILYYNRIAFVPFSLAYLTKKFLLYLIRRKFSNEKNARVADWKQRTDSTEDRVFGWRQFASKTFGIVQYTKCFIRQRRFAVPYVLIRGLIFPPLKHRSTTQRREYLRLTDVKLSTMRKKRKSSMCSSHGKNRTLTFSAVALHKWEKNGIKLCITFCSSRKQTYAKPPRISKK